MGLQKDLSGLPKAATLTSEGVPPDPEPTVLMPWIEAEQAAHLAEGTRPQAFVDTHLRHSVAGRCARALGYYVQGVPESDPFDLASIMSTRNGTRQHDLVQSVLNAHGMEVEVPVRVGGECGSLSSGSADGFYNDWAGVPVCWEHKNVGGYAYKLALGIRPAASTAQGPKRMHIVQGALNALGGPAERLVITYLTWEPISKGAARQKGLSEAGRFAAQWTFEREQWEPLALAESKRMERIVDLVLGGELPARVIPDPDLPPRHVIEDPSTGAWMAYDTEGLKVEGGTHWECDYCSWQTFCSAMPGGRLPLADMAMIAARAGLKHEAEA